ncbi:ComEC/Rec2 family competence protein, partial [Acidovorax temperans]|uniref:ComEC/Rec2 family competence protein n=1 Tax=Acidovorax temperans TaxID=80878 RepID=UPI0035B2C57E
MRSLLRLDASRRYSLLVPSLLGWVAGSALQLQQAALWSWPIYASIVALAPVLCAWAAIKNIADWGRWSLVAVAAVLLGVGVTGLRAGALQADRLPAALEGQDLRVVAVVVGMPQRMEQGLRLRLGVESAQTVEGQPVQLPQRVDVAWYGGTWAPAGTFLEGLNRLPANVQAGERWALTLRLKAPHGGLNPHGLDYELYLWEQGVGATGYVRATARDPAPVRLAQTGRYPLAWARQAVRDRILAHLTERQVAGLVAAWVVGDQAAIERADWDVFRATGVAHLVSISGLHITMFAWAAAALLGWLWRRSARLCQALPAPNAALLGGLALATAYALFAGWGVPAQRTCWMLATVGILRLAGVRWPWGVVWLLAGAVVVAADPWALLQAGFWLSFVAVGVLFATDHGRSPPAAPALGPARAWHTLVALAREQWTITLALAPLTLLLFGQFSVVGLLANALAIPWITLVLTPLSLAGVLVPLLWEIASAAIG